MLVHICCSVDSHYFLTRLREDYPNEKLIGYFYNPNIFPKSEYNLRLVDAKRSCNKLGIEFLEGVYDDENWAKNVRGMEEIPEKGSRCEVCFDIRFENSALKAKELEINTFTSTLLQSPLKDKNQLKKSLAKISTRYGVEFVFVDYLSNGGKEAQSKTANNEGLYRQNYCGCVWGVINQRKNSTKPNTECFSPLDKTVLPSSSEKRIQIYTEFAKKPKAQKSIKSKILNYRLLNAKLEIDGKTIPSYIPAYSTSGKKSFTSMIDFEDDGIIYLKKESAKIINLSKWCQISGKNYKNLNELLSNPPSFEEQVFGRFKISGAIYDISPIFVVEELSKAKSYTITLDALFFEDTDENIPKGDSDE